MIELSIAVADLARFCHRRGDIDHRFSAAPTGAQGIAGHQRLYARRPASYRSEYALEHRYLTDKLQLTLRGRADGYDPEQAMVEEIKTCRVAPGSIPEHVAQLHLAQGRLYAAIIALQDDVEHMQVRVTWLNIDSDEQWHRNEHYSRAQLQDFLQTTLAAFADWLHTLSALRYERDNSLAALAFPHGEFRDGQRDMAELSYKCIDQAGRLLLEAPTGIGKTAAVLFPALKALARGKHDKIVFATSKAIGRQAAESTLARFTATGYRGTALSLSAKDTVCLSPGRACHPDDCPYARGYYDKLPQAMQAAMQLPSLRREDIESLAQRFEVCPYELSLDLLPWVDLVIADVHYVYSLGAMIGGTMETGDQRWTVLLDEAHNLPGRARNMYSARLAKADLMAARAAASGTLGKALERINRQFLALQKQDWQTPEFDSSAERPEALLLALQAFTSAAAEQVAQEPACLHRQPEVLAFYFEVLQFLRVAEQWGSEYRLQLRRDGGRQSLCISLNCLDPARLLATRQQRAHAVIAFSATLSPLDWARASLGLGADAVCSRARSPFHSDQLRVYLATDVDTRYRERSASLGALAQRIQQWLAREPGNCIVYFPSYAYMQDCLNQLAATPGALEGRTLWCQQREASPSQQQALLDLLGQQRDIAAFCILGGIFGEAIDLPGDQLSSVVVVGVGMPQINTETRQLQGWFDAASGRGFEYTYLYPGMQKVDQALGRVVRGLDDHGAALLIDPRYRERQYRELLPRWWNYYPWPGERPTGNT